MFRLCSIVFLLAAAGIQATAEQSHVLVLPPGKDSALIRATAMPELGDSRIENILSRYFREGLGGPEVWDAIESLNVAGKLKTESGELILNAYQKKPNFIKMNLYVEAAPNGLVLAYDGQVAWKQENQRAKPEPMSESEARRFIHASTFGNHLLYPFAKGKRISLVDTVPVEGTICHQVRVELDTEYQVDYFIDIRTYLEIKVVNTDLRSGAVNSIVYRDYVRKSGMPIAQKLESSEDGKWVSSLDIEEIKINSGIMPWMFHMPKSSTASN